MYRANVKRRAALLTAMLVGGAALAGPLVAEAVDGHVRTASVVPESQRIRDFSDATLARIVPGRTTKAEVQALLGKPWRETELDEEDVMYPGDPSVAVWEYRGRGPKGPYRVHVEFDKRDATTLIARIPDKAARAVARVAGTVEAGKR
jgi:outer membrane protein assembly factor BamE (lipoprotein component of BamABCDE complex)